MPNETENQPHPERELEAVSAKASDEAVSRSRRRFTRAGLAAPVVMSLSSRSVWGQIRGGAPAQCLSTQMSGNLSQQNKPPECRLGWPPDAWTNPQGTIDSRNTREAWAFVTMLSEDDAYGALKAGQTADNCANFEGGLSFASMSTFGAPPRNGD